MSSRIEQLFAEFVTAMGADDEESPLYTKIKLGRKCIHENTDAPRIVWCLNPGSVTAPDGRVGGVLFPSDNSRARIIRLHATEFELYIQAKTLEDTETLLHNSVQALESMLSGSLAFGNTDWPSEAEGGTDFRGFVVTLAFTVQVAMYDVQKPLTVVNGFVDEDKWGEAEEDTSCRPDPEPEP